MHPSRLKLSTASIWSPGCILPSCTQAMWGNVFHLNTFSISDPYHMSSSTLHHGLDKDPNISMHGRVLYKRNINKYMYRVALNNDLPKVHVILYLLYMYMYDIALLYNQPSRGIAAKITYHKTSGSHAERGHTLPPMILMPRELASFLMFTWVTTTSCTEVGTGTSRLDD